MLRATCHKKTSHLNRPTTKISPFIKPSVFVPISDISDIPSFPSAFSIKAHLSPCLLSIQSFLFPLQTSNQKTQLPVKSLYSALEGTDALLFAAALDAEESDKDNVGVVGIGDDSIELDAQTELKERLAFLAKDLLSDNNIDKETDGEDYFLFVPVCNSKGSDINAMEIDDLPNQKPYHQQGPRCSTIQSSFCSTSHAKHKLINILKSEAFVPRQRWGIDRILATLVNHQKDPNLRTAYCQFKTFAY